MGYWVASFILSMIDQTIGAGLYKERNSKLQKQASQLASEIAKDQALLNKLRDAYNRRDTELGSAILQQSPFSSSFFKLKQAYKDNKTKLKSIDSDIEQSQVNATKAQNQMNEKIANNTTTGSAIVDLITGATNYDSSAPKYESLGGKYDSKN